MLQARRKAGPCPVEGPAGARQAYPREGCNVELGGATIRWRRIGYVFGLGQYDSRQRRRFLYSPRESGDRGRIQIHESRYPQRPERGKASFDELWQRVVFELHNIVEARKVLPESRKEVIAGRMTKDQYIRSCLVAEIRTDKKVQAFYAKRYLLWASDKNINADYRVWHVDSYWTKKWERDVADPNMYVGRRQFLGEQYDIIWIHKLVDLREVGRRCAICKGSFVNDVRQDISRLHVS